MFFYSPVGAAANGDDDADIFGNPVRRMVGPGAPWWIEECACCLCGCLSTGPLFIIVGMIFLVRPRRVWAHAALSWHGSERARRSVLTRRARS